MFFIIFMSFHNTPSICQQDKSVKTLFSDKKYFPSYLLFFILYEKKFPHLERNK